MSARDELNTAFLVRTMVESFKTKAEVEAFANDLVERMAERARASAHRHGADLTEEQIVDLIGPILRAVLDAMDAFPRQGLPS